MLVANMATWCQLPRCLQPKSKLCCKFVLRCTLRHQHEQSLSVKTCSSNALFKLHGLCGRHFPRFLHLRAWRQHSLCTTAQQPPSFILLPLGRSHSGPTFCLLLNIASSRHAMHMSNLHGDSFCNAVCISHTLQPF